MKSIALIGFMGSGKTSVGEKLAEALKYNCIDTDAMIVEKYGVISDIFETKGEAYFRDIETETLKEALELTDTVICTGGGIILKDENRAMLRDNARVVYLETSPETVYERVYNDDARPLLKGKKNVEDIATMMAGRLPKYQDAAEYIVTTDNKSIEEIVAEILSKISK